MEFLPIGAGQRSCPLCDSAVSSAVFTSKILQPANVPYEVRRCARCRLLFTSPSPTADELAALYDGSFYPPPGEDGLGLNAARRLLARVAFRHRLKAFLSRKGGRLLDVGCGDGSFLLRLKKRGWDVSGVDSSHASRQACRDRQIDSHQGDLASVALSDKLFDVVTMFHVVEHLAAPRIEVAQVRHILKDDGILIVEVPNAGSPTLRLCGESWWPCDIPRHLQHFTRDTLTRLLSAEGFEIVREQNLHLADWPLALMSVLEWMGILGGRHGLNSFVAGFRKASVPRRILFGAVGLLLAVAGWPFWLVAVLSTGASETLTVTARKR